MVFIGLHISLLLEIWTITAFFNAQLKYGLVTALKYGQLNSTEVYDVLSTRVL